MSDCFGGPTKEEKSLEAQQASLASTMAANYGTVFSEDQKTIGAMVAELGQLQSGQTGPGFGGAEEASRVAQIQNNAAAAARNTAQAVRQATAGQGGGAGDSSGIASGVRRQLTEEAASSATANENNALLANTSENYATGRAVAAQTIGGLQALSGQLNPNAAGAGATNAGTAAFNEASTIEQQQAAADAAMWGTITGGIGAASSILTGGLSKLAGPPKMTGNLPMPPLSIAQNASLMLGPH